MGLATAMAALKTHLEGLSNVTVYISGNAPDKFWNALSSDGWPDGTNRTIVLYAGDSTVKGETGGRVRRIHDVSISAYVQDDDASTRGTTLHTLFDDINGILPSATGLTMSGNSDPIDSVQQPQAGIRLHAKLIYC